MTSYEIEALIRHQEKVWKAFQDSLDNAIRKFIQMNHFPNSIRGAVTKTTLTKNGIKEDSGGITIKW